MINIDYLNFGNIKSTLETNKFLFKLLDINECFKEIYKFSGSNYSSISSLKNNIEIFTYVNDYFTTYYRNSLDNEENYTICYILKDNIFYRLIHMETYMKYDIIFTLLFKDISKEILFVKDSSLIKSVVHKNEKTIINRITNALKGLGVKNNIVDIENIKEYFYNYRYEDIDIEYLNYVNNNSNTFIKSVLYNYERSFIKESVNRDLFAKERFPFNINEILYCEEISKYE